jgi:hypothetical protein
MTPFPRNIKSTQSQPPFTYSLSSETSPKNQPDGNQLPDNNTERLSLSEKFFAGTLIILLKCAGYLLLFRKIIYQKKDNYPQGTLRSREPGLIFIPEEDKRKKR